MASEKSKLSPILPIVIVTLTACGGGSGGSGTGPQPQEIQQQDPPPAADEIIFTRDTETGLARSFPHELDDLTDSQRFHGGVAAADYDADGDVDLLIVGGNSDPNQLFQNQGDGTYIDVAASVDLDIVNWGSGPAFGDIDGDGDLDLFIGAVEDDPYYLFENRLDEADGTFVDVTSISGITIGAENTVSATFYDYDQDGFLDLFLAHWGTERISSEDTETLWRNNGDRTFTNRSLDTGIAPGLLEQDRDWTYTPNLTDIDGDGDGDLLMAAEFETSQVFVNNGDGTFTKTSDREVLVDQAGMGAAVGDYDNDGDMDWFVSSIFKLNTPDGDLIGNRLYRNDGTGVFEDVTSSTGVANGRFGWGSCFADFDNDGYLDLFHVNGYTDMQGIEFVTDQVRFFYNNGDGTFDQLATDVGLTDTGQGRGLVCFDDERDGDIDIVITNSSPEAIVYYRNEGTNNNHYLSIRLEGGGTNRFGIGAHITVTTDDGSQVRELGGSNNFTSHNPFEVHFGLGSATTADISVRWPDGTVSEMAAADADQLITITQ